MFFLFRQLLAHVGWGDLQLGHSGGDLEPGRCRRTDGKKWRCSKDAVVNHKYCERHLNRGRHRSRKPVEARSGSTKASGGGGLGLGLGAPRNASSPAASAVSSTGSTTINSCATTQLQKNSLPSSPEHSSTHFIRMPAIKDEGCGHHQHFTDSQSFVAPNASLRQITEETSSPGRRKQEHGDDKEFCISSQPFLLHSLSRYQPMDNRTFPSFEPPERDCQLSQLPTLVPNAVSHLSASSSPTQTQDDFTNLSKMPEPLSLGTQEQQISWVPVSWDVSMGGPLGEALSRAYNGGCFSKASLAQSPDDVLQRTTTFNSSSDSAGSSPRDEHFLNIDPQPNFLAFNPFLSY